MANYRKTQDQSDSLELLLDTMCNTFGGIMFIAISLVVLSSFISGGESDEEQPVKESLSSLRMKAKKNEQSIQRIQTKIDSVKTLAEAMKNSPAKQLIKDVAELEKKTMKQQTEIDRIKQLKTDLNNQISRLVTDNHKKNNKILKDQVAKSKLARELAKLKEQYRKAKISHEEGQDVRKLSFSTLKKTTRYPYWGILSNNKFYDINNPDDIKTENVSGNGIRYTPVSSAGLTVGHEKLAYGIKNMLNNIKRKNQFICLFVLPDSFLAMTNIKKYIQDNRMRCNWYPVLTFHECVLYPATSDTFESE